VSRSGGPNGSRVVARTRHGEISLDEMAELLPGLGALMPIISRRYVQMYFAAKGGNWPLANYQYLQMVHVFRTGMKTRPKHAARIRAYLADFGEPLRASIRARDWEAFERASGAAVDEANRIHVDLRLPYIVFRLPDAPPGHLDYAPQPVEADPEEA
jgi:hypothetical protein